MSRAVIDWSAIGPSILAEYAGGRSPADIAAAVGLKRTTVRAFIRRNSGLRTQSESARLAALAGKKDRAISAMRKASIGRVGHNPPKAARTCESCGREYAPNAPRQKWCFACVPDIRFRRLMQRYGVSKPAFDAMLAAQGGRCALCPLPPSVVDHNHSTGRVRGLLCGGCNSALSRVEISGWVEKAESYALR